MVAATPLPKPSEDVIFDGNPLDLDRVIGYTNVQQMLYVDAFGDDDVRRSGFLALHFRGAALDWFSRYTSDAQGAARMADYGGFLNIVKAQFGYDLNTLQAGAQTELMSLRQAGEYSDLIEFLNHFVDLATRAGVASDVSRVTLLYPKLNDYYRTAITTKGGHFVRFTDARNFLMSVYSHTPANGRSDQVKRSQARCKKCGRRGHTGTQCSAKN